MIKKILFFTTFMYLGFGLILYLLQNKLLFRPADELKLKNISEKKFNNDGHSIKSFVVNPNLSSAIIYFGGNAESVGNSVYFYEQLFPNHTVYMVDYRGYGGSTGEPSEKAFFSDALSIYDELKNQHQQLSVIGRSLGSGVATYLASKRDVHKLTLITPYDSILAVAQDSFPILPISMLLKNHFNSIKYASLISIDTLIFVAEHDKVVTRKRTEKLLEALTKETTFYLNDTNHSNITSSSEFSQNIQIFYNQ